MYFLEWHEDRCDADSQHTVSTPSTDTKAAAATLLVNLFMECCGVTQEQQWNPMQIRDGSTPPKIQLL